MPATAEGPPPRSALGRVGAEGSWGYVGVGRASSGPWRGLRCSGPGANLPAAPEPRPGDPQGSAAAPQARPCLAKNGSRVSMCRRLPSLPTKAVTPAGRCQLRQPWCGVGPRSVVLPEASLAIAVLAFPQVGCLPRVRAVKGPRRGSPGPAAAWRRQLVGPRGRAVLPRGPVPPQVTPRLPSQPPLRTTSFHTGHDKMHRFLHRCLPSAGVWVTGKM